MIGISGQVLGIQDTLAAFRRLEDKVRAQVLSEVVEEGSKIVEKAIKQAIRETGASETKSLEKSIGRKKKKYRRSAIVSGIVGARVGFRREVSRNFTPRGKQRIKTRRVGKGQSGKGEVRDPAKYIHLANKGRKALSGKLMPVRLRNGVLKFARHVKAAKGHDFMRRAYEASAGMVKAAMIARLKAGVERAIADSAAKGQPKR